MISGLYAITNQYRASDDAFFSKIETVLYSGCQFLQYRDKENNHSDKIDIAKQLRQLCTQHSAYLIINDSIELAEEIGADGVHLGQNDALANEARQRLGSKAIVGITCHNSLALAQQAVKENATYVAFGRFFSSQTKPDATAAPISLLENAKQQLNIPVVAIGGINSDNAAQLIMAGADCLAVSNDLFELDNLETISHRVKYYQSLFL